MSHIGIRVKVLAGRDIRRAEALGTRMLRHLGTPLETSKAMV
jgi:hypothetical protein